MNDLTALRDPRLIPVLELEPWRFSTHERPLPSGWAIEMPEAWGRYWHACLADSGVTGLIPLYPGSWHVLVRELDDEETLLKMLRTLLRDEGGTETPIDAEDSPALDGGMALFSEGELLVEPTCCSDLGNISEWRSAAAYRGPGWRIVWIGHPWLSVRYEGARLVLSGPHESNTPPGRWTVDPEVLVRAVDAAEVKLEGFARRLEGVLVNLGSGDRPGRLARRLAGLAS